MNNLFDIACNFSSERFDKDLFRNDEGDIVPAYREILDRLQPLL